MAKAKWALGEWQRLYVCIKGNLNKLSVARIESVTWVVGFIEGVMYEKASQSAGCWNQSYAYR